VSCRETAFAENQTARERIIDLLLDASRRLGSSRDIRIPFADHVIADRLDLPRPIVASQLNEFEMAGVIARIPTDDLLLTDAARLLEVTSVPGTQ
jgi:CRP-like cAMP-binding protein